MKYTSNRTPLRNFFSIIIHIKINKHQGKFFMNRTFSAQYNAMQLFPNIIPQEQVENYLELLLMQV